jgi:hypothetical protein
MRESELEQTMTRAPDPQPWRRPGMRRLPAWLLAACVGALTATQAGALDMKVVAGGDDKQTTIELTGLVVVGDGLKMRSFVGGLATSKPIVAQVAFAGGQRAEAMSIGRFFHQLRVRTVVPAKMRCLSPCPLVLVGGRDPASGRAGYVKYSSASLGFTGVTPNYTEKEYTLADLDSAVAATQRDILQIADFLRDVGADMEILRYYQSVLKQNDVHYITNEQALDLGIAVLLEETGQVIEPLKPRRN